MKKETTNIWQYKVGINANIANFFVFVITPKDPEITSNYRQIWLPNHLNELWYVKQDSIMNSVHADDWTAKWGIIAGDDFHISSHVMHVR